MLAPSPTAGNSSGVSPTSRYDAPAHRRATHAFSCTLIARGADGSSFTISMSLRAEIVMVPGFTTLAGPVTRTLTSRSVAVIRSVSPCASSSTLASTGSVWRGSTTL